MPIKVSINLNNLNKKYSKQNLEHARKLALNDAQQAMEKYVPQLSGDLRNAAAEKIDGTGIIYAMPYAKAQFYGFITNKYGGPFRIHHYTTTAETPPDYVNTSRRWDLRLKGNKQDMKKVKEAFVNGANWHK